MAGRARRPTHAHSPEGVTESGSLSLRVMAIRGNRSSRGPEPPWFLVKRIVEPSPFPGTARAEIAPAKGLTRDVSFPGLQLRGRRSGVSPRQITQPHPGVIVISPDPATGSSHLMFVSTGGMWSVGAPAAAGATHEPAATGYSRTQG